MNQRKVGDIASGMMLVWLAFYIFGVLIAPKWADFIGILGCTVPMFAFKHRTRGKTFGTRDCNTVIYKKQEYAAFFAFCISGCALLSAITYWIANLGGVQTAATIGRGDFFYPLVFSCMIPAFFEEWLVRGGVLGVFAKYGSAGVWMCAILFTLMHISPVKWGYALFAGLMITALVYLTECIYLGMILHFCNNFVSLLLSYLPRGAAEAIALLVIAAVFVSSLLSLARGKLFADTVKLLREVQGKQLRELLTPAFWVIVGIILFMMFWQRHLQ